MTTETKWALSKAGYYADFVLVPIAMVAALTWAVWQGWFGARWFAFAAGGLISWTLIEYLVHRIIFHGDNSYAREHLKHHEHEADYIGVSSAGTVLGFAIAAALLLRAVGPADAAPAMFGLMGGYLLYIVVHDQMHHSVVGPSSWLYALKMHHVGHHRGAAGNYGVTTRFWDVVFGTFVKR